MKTDEQYEVEVFRLTKIIQRKEAQIDRLTKLARYYKMHVDLAYESMCNGDGCDFIRPMGVKR